MSDRVLVTGAAGYLGSQVVARLLDRGVEVIGCVRAGVGTEIGADLHACELSSPVAVQAMLKEVRPTAVVHAAAWIGQGSATRDCIGEAIESNVMATANVATACALAAVSRLIFCSSVEVYAAAPQNNLSHCEEDALDPQGLYGQTKAAGEYAVRALEGTGTVPLVLRMPGLHGGSRRHGVVHRFWDAVAKGLAVDIAEPETRLSFLWVTDAARVIASAALGEIQSEEGVLNIANGDATLLELAESVGRMSGRSLDIRRGSKTPRNRALDLDRMGRVLPFSLRPFEDGLRDSLTTAPAA